MKSPQKFKIVNPKSSSCETIYERNDSLPMWQRCLQYRPRIKDFRALMLPRDKIRRMRRSVRKLCSPTPPKPGRALSKHAVSSRRVSEAPTASIKPTQTSGHEHDVLPKNSVPIVKFVLPRSFDTTLSYIPAKDSKAEAVSAEVGTGRALSTNYEPHQSDALFDPNHEIGMALTTSQTVLNYPHARQNTHNDKAQGQTNRPVRGNDKSGKMSSWDIVQFDKRARSIKPKRSTLTGLVDISTLVPEYSQPKRRSVAPKRPEDEVQHQHQHQPSPYSTLAHGLVQVFELEASRKEQEQEQEEMKDMRYRDRKKSRTPRDSRRCGQVWDVENTSIGFLEIEAHKALADLTLADLRLT